VNGEEEEEGGEIDEREEGRGVGRGKGGGEIGGK